MQYHLLSLDSQLVYRTFPFAVLSQNGRLCYGYARSQATELWMEDYYDTRLDMVDGELVGMFGVYDGLYHLCPILTSKLLSVPLIITMSLQSLTF